MTSTKVVTGPAQVKSEAAGELEVVFATFNVVDRDGDVTLPGAFEEGGRVDVSAYGHSIYKGAAPVGEGRIRTTSREAVADLQLYMDTTAGRDTFALVKARGEHQRWSYGFDVLNPRETTMVNGRKANVLRRLRAKEVSPVWEAAGLGTRTLAAKGGLDGVDVDELLDIRARHEQAALRDELAAVQLRLELLGIKAALLS